MIIIGHTGTRTAPWVHFQIFAEPPGRIHDPYSSIGVYIVVLVYAHEAMWNLNIYIYIYMNILNDLNMSNGFNA